MIETEFLDELKRIGSGLKEGKTGTLSELRALERKLDLIDIYKQNSLPILSSKLSGSYGEILRLMPLLN
jgi:hypothetical protein